MFMPHADDDDLALRVQSIGDDVGLSWVDMRWWGELDMKLFRTKANIIAVFPASIATEMWLYLP